MTPISLDPLDLTLCGLRADPDRSVPFSMAANRDHFASIGATGTRVLFSPYLLVRAFLGHALSSVLVAAVIARSAYSLFQQHMFSINFSAGRASVHAVRARS